jgi:hypothetical protein
MAARHVVGIVVLLSGCGSTSLDPLDDIPARRSRPVIAVAVRPDGIVLAVGDTVRMRATAVPPAEVRWDWLAGPGGLAAVDPTGLVRALAPGDVTVQACTELPDRVCGAAPLTIR